MSWAGPHQIQSKRMLFLNDKVIYLYIYNTKSFAGRGCFLFSIENKQAKHHLQERAIEHNYEKTEQNFYNGNNNGLDKYILQ